MAPHSKYMNTNAITVDDVNVQIHLNKNSDKIFSLQNAEEGEKRKVPINIENSNYLIDIDYVIMALGSKPDEFVSELELELNKWGYLQINEKNQTSNSKVFAGGDIAGTKGTVAWAARSGRDAAYSIMEYLK